MHTSVEPKDPSPHPPLVGAIEAGGTHTFIVPPRLGDDAGICGAMALAHDRIGVWNV